jgi:hypothetical protein
LTAPHWSERDIARWRGWVDGVGDLLSIVFYLRFYKWLILDTMME